MIKITYRTLTTMDEYLPSGEKLREFCKMLIKTGVNFIELSVAVYEKMDRILPEGVNYMLHLDALSNSDDYTGITHFSSRYSKINIVKNNLYEIQVNDIREINGLNQYSDLSNVRITGLDSIMCNDYERIFENLKGIFNGSIDLCPENKYHCATAIAVEWVLSGEQNISCSFAGAGGYAALEEILIALRISIRRKPNLDLSFLPEMKKLYEEITNTKIAKNKPILGDEIFTVEAGIHIDGLLKNPIIYEPYDPKIVGAKRTIVAGKHSGRKAIKAMLLKLKIKVLDSSLSCIVKKIQEKSMEYGRSLTNDELIRIANEVNPIEGKKIYN